MILKAIPIIRKQRLTIELVSHAVPATPDFTSDISIFEDSNRLILLIKVIS